MTTSNHLQVGLSHDQITVEGLTIHVVQGGKDKQPSIVFLHGWPESWALYEEVMDGLSDQAHVVAMDLPGVGLSEGAPEANDKRTLARYVKGVIKALGLKNVTLVGHDCGGMVVYAYLHAYKDLEQAVIMNTVIPGVDPWNEVIHNPYIWHFSFHAIPEVPEQLVTGHEDLYFDYFFNTLSGPNDVSEELRERFTYAYCHPQALHMGFEWYRAFAQDAKDNAADKDKPIDTPVLYLRGDHENFEMEKYLNGLRDNGLHQLEGQIIPDSGHFSPSENPEAVVEALRKFVAS